MQYCLLRNGRRPSVDAELDHVFIVARPHAFIDAGGILSPERHVVAIARRLVRYELAISAVFGADDIETVSDIF